MNEYVIYFKLEDGYEGETSILATNRIMACEEFTELSKDYNSPVVEFDCYRVID